MRQWKRKPRRSVGRLSVEALEARWLPSTLTFQFADSVGVVGSGSVDVESNSVDNDAAGNVYVTGSLVGTADFNPGTAVTNLTSTGGRDVFVAKYGPTGALAWADDLRGATASSVAQGGAVVVDASGNVLVTGTYTGTVNFDARNVNAAATFTSPKGGNDVFIAKYDPTGALLWARDVAGTAGAIDEGYALAVDPSGNVVAAGSFANSATFGTATLTAGGNFDGFVTKLSPAGQFLWATATTGSGSSVAQANGVTLDGSGNVITTGFYAGTVDFNPGAGVVTLPYVGAEDVYVQKLDASGNFVWAGSVGSPDISQGLGIAADAAGNLLVTGTFALTANFNPGPGAAVNLTAGGFEDAFLMKLTPAGQLAWAKDLSVSQFSAARGTGVALDGSGNAFVSGYYQNGITLDPTAPGALLTGAGGYDVFVAEYGPTGNYLAGQSAGGANFDAGFGIGVNSTGQVAIAGRYSGPASFGPITLPAQPGKSIFIAQLAAPVVVAPPAPGVPVLEAGSDTGSSHSDRVTNATALVLDENTVSDPGNLVQLYRDGVLVGSRTGAGPITDAGPVPDGVHLYTAQQTTAAGVAGPLSGSVSVTVDTQSPATPTTPTLNPLDDSGVKGDGITNVKQPRITGAADPNAAVQLLDSFGNVLAATTTAAGGSYTFTAPSPLSDGPAPFRVREQDAAGNLSAASAGMNLVIDATPPAAPPAPSLLAADDTGTVGDGVTTVTLPHLTGTAPAGSTVQVLNMNSGGSLAGTATAAANGTYSVQPTAPLAPGTFAFAAQVVDVAGNIGTPGAVFNLTIQASVTPPTPSAPVLLAADDSGAQGDGITNVRQPRLTGLADPNVQVQLLDSFGNVLAVTTTTAGGSYTFTAPSPLSDGPAPFRVREQDAAGNLSAASAAMNLVIDATPPAAPSTPAILAADDSGTLGDGVTSVEQPRLTGTAAPGSAVQLLDATNAVIGTTTATAGGTYTVAPSTPYADGTYAVHAQSTDVAGNTSSASGTFSLAILTPSQSAPSTPALLPADDSGVRGDGITNVNQPRLTGTTTPLTTVQLVNASNAVIGTTTSDGNGLYTVSPSAPIADGTYALHVQAADASGNPGPASGAQALTVLTAPPASPAAPVLLPADDSGIKGDGITNVKQPRITGAADPNAAVQLLDSFGNVLAATTTAADGSYTFTAPAPLSDGPAPFRVREQDAAGNLSAASAGMSLIIDATPPAAPSAPTILAADDSGTLGDGLTNVNHPRLVGLAPAGTTVQLLNPVGKVLATSVATSGGTYSLSPGPMLDGSHRLSVQVVDVAGNVSAPGAPLTFTTLTTPPAAPAAPALLAADDSGAQGDRITNVNTPHLVGTAQPGMTVQLVGGSGAVLASTTASANGGYSLQPPVALPDGSVSFQVRAIDAAGNAGPLGPSLTLTILTAPPASPAAPSIAVADDTGTVGDRRTAVRKPHVVGTAQAGSTVDLLDPNGNVLATTTAAAAGGGYSLLPASNLNAGTIALKVRARDAAGNVSAVSPALVLTIVDAAPSDFDGDGKTDVVTFRPSTAQWIGRTSSGTSFVTAFGAPAFGDIPVPADYDGVGHSEYAVFRPSTGQWLIGSPTGLRIVQFGRPNLADIPVPADYDGVGHAELAVFRPSTGQWLISSPTGVKTIPFGQPNLADIPVPGDYDGVGHAELAVFRASTAQWLIAAPKGVRTVQFGQPKLADIPVPGDYDGTGRTELAVFRPATSTWTVLGPKGIRTFTFGAKNLVDVPVEAPVGSLKKLGTVGGIHFSTATVAVPAASAAGSPAASGVASAPARTTAKAVQVPASVARKLSQAVVDQAIAGLYANGPLSWHGA